MINKENDDKEPVNEQVKKEAGIMDTANMDVQCHLLIKDKDSGEVIVNKRG